MIFALRLLGFLLALSQQRVEKLPAIAYDEPEPLPFLMMLPQPAEQRLTLALACFSSLQADTLLRASTMKIVSLDSWESFKGQLEALITETQKL